MKGQFHRNPRHGQGPTKEKSERVPVHQNDSQVLFDKQRQRERTLAVRTRTIKNSEKKERPCYNPSLPQTAIPSVTRLLHGMHQ